MMSLVDLGKRLLEAAKGGNTDEVRSLMSSGAPFTTDWLGTSPLHFAAQSGHFETADVLLRAGISRDARTKVDRTPLHVASQAGHLDIVELLLKHNADLEAKDMLKMTPLHWAVEKEHIEIVDFLIRNHADITCENKFEKSAVDLALSKCRHDMATMMQLSQPDGSVPEVCLDNTEQGLTEEVTATTALEEDMSGDLIMDDAGVNVKKEQVCLDEATVDQSSTSVLATLAALAEVAAPMSSQSNNATKAGEALNWLETHGITMMSGNDAQTYVSNQIDQGHSLTLTEAGKLALNLVNQEKGENEGDSADEENVLDAITERTASGVVVENEEDTTPVHIPHKRVIIEGPKPACKKRKVEDTSENDLRKQLEQVQREAADFKLQLQQKHQEAEGYKKKLQEKEDS